MDSHRKLWNQGPKALLRALSANDHEKAVALFLDQHAMMHSRRMAGGKALVV